MKLPLTRLVVFPTVSLYDMVTWVLRKNEEQTPRIQRTTEMQDLMVLRKF